MNRPHPGLARHTGLFLLGAMLTACGGAGGTGIGNLAAPTTAPVISDLHFSPQALYASTAPMPFTGAVTFSDPDGDVTSLTITIVDPFGATVMESTPVQAAGTIQGVLGGWLTAALPVPGTYTFTVFVTDGQGLQSNTLTGSLRVARFPWTNKQASPTPREYMAVATLNDRIYVLGGERTHAPTIPGPVTAEMETYDPATDTWAPAPPMPTARMGLVAAVVNGRLYAIGGSVNAYGFGTGVVEEFDPDTQQWTARASMPTPRCFAAGALVGTQIVVAGGSTWLASEMSVVESYDPVADNWATAAPLTVARRELSAAASGGLLYAVGGYAGLLPQWTGTVEAFDPATGLWSARATMPTPRSHLTLVGFAGQLLAAGGENVARSLEVLESFDPIANSWRSLSASPVPFSRAGAAVLNGKMYVIGDGLTLEYDPLQELR